jgi:hypothetical protein
VSTAIPHIGEIRGWRPISISGDRKALVRMVGTSSGFHYGRVAEPYAYVPGTDLGGVILVDITSAAGDSGAALVDNQGYVLGLLIGELTSHPGWRAFSPISSILGTLNCNIP